MTISKTFSNIGAFAASLAAEQYLRERGFSIGFTEGNAPRGVRFGDCTIAKWRNLSERDKQNMHGAMSGNPRNGPVTVDLFESAPTAAIGAFAAQAELAELA